MFGRDQPSAHPSATPGTTRVSTVRRHMPAGL
jgi:hypothetical protein